MRRSRLLFAIVPLLIVAGLACSKDSGPPPSDVVSAIPWPQAESLDYLLQDPKGKELGRATLSVNVSGETTTLRQLSTSATNRDDASVVVDSKTLKPQSAKREITSSANSSNNETIEVTYTDQGAVIKQGDRQSGISVPEHAYDNDTSLFLWRTLPFADGYTGAYTTIITNRRNSQKVVLRVLGHETVTVPGGSFNAWKLQVETSNAKQTAWFADTPSRPLVRYDNDRGTIFVLASKP